MIALLILLLSVPAFAAESTVDSKALSSYSFDASKPLADRVAPIPPFVLAEWSKMDGMPQYQDYAPTAEERKAFAAALDGLPPAMQAALKERVIGFYFVKNLKGNGITDWVLDSSSRAYCYTIFNPAAFKKTVSQVLTERERTPFKGAADISVDAGNDNGILYTVSHELAHAFDYTRGLTPYTEPGVAKAQGRPMPKKWDVWADYGKPLPEYDFSGRDKLTFYGFGKTTLTSKDAARLCEGLEKSPFTSLYGSRAWAEDAAELFVVQHLIRDLGRPYRVTCAGRTYEPMMSPLISQRAARILAPLYAGQ